jgi:hypothetical protein
MPSNEFVTSSPHPTHRRWVRLAIVLTATALVALIASTHSASAQTYGPKPASAPWPVALDVFSPTSGEIAGKDGAGFVVDLTLTARNRAANGLLSFDAGYKPFFNNPSAPTSVPGPGQGAPGLVVLLSTTPTTPGTPFQGPNTNLAGLFQINGVSMVKGGLLRTSNTWQIGRAAFGSGSATLTAYVVKGTAPALVPDAGLEKISNSVKVRFTIPLPGNASPARSGNLTPR